MTVPPFMLQAEEWPCLYPPHLQKDPVLIQREYRVFAHVKRFRIIKVCKLCVSSHYPSTKTLPKCGKSAVFQRESSENRGFELDISTCRPS